MWATPGFRIAPRPDGRSYMRYFFWEANRKGWLEPNPARDETLRVLSGKGSDESVGQHGPR